MDCLRKLKAKTKEYKELTEEYFLKQMKNNPILFDLKGIYNKKNYNNLKYWRL